MLSCQTAPLERFNNPLRQRGAYLIRKALSSCTRFVFGGSLIIAIAVLNASTFSHQSSLDRYLPFERWQERLSVIDTGSILAYLADFRCLAVVLPCA